jgi:hypothetical protein
MTIYKAINGQTIADICMNTYGSMDYFFKLVQDSGIADGDQVPYTGQEFKYDEMLVLDSSVNRTTTLGNIIYATGNSGNGNTYYITTGTPTIVDPTTPVVPPPIPLTMYQKTSQTSYTSASNSGETVISIPSLAGKDITAIEKEIKPLKANEFSWNKTTFTLTLTDAIYKDETLFILYSEMITI